MIVAALFVIAGVGPAYASARSFSLPTSNGQPISACLAQGPSCGKAAADIFCQSQGYSESILFAREPVATALVLDTGGQCSDGTCQAFTRIKCYRPKGAEQANAQ